MERETRAFLGGAGLDKLRLDATIGGRDFDVLRVRLGRLANRRAAQLVAKYGAQLERFTSSQIAAVLSIDPTTAPASVQRALEAWRRENVDLITSIADRLHDDVVDVVRAAVQSGTRVETIARQLSERFSVSDSRARLIARDQVLKGNADLSRQRFQAAGVTRYVWSTSRDEKVRPMHTALEGRVFAFNDPPITNEKGEKNNPGEDISCRCVPIPVLAS